MNDLRVGTSSHRLAEDFVLDLAQEWPFSDGFTGLIGVKWQH